MMQESPNNAGKKTMNRKYNSIQKSCGWPESYSLIKNLLGEKETEEIFKKADSLLAEYKEKYKSVKGIEKMHVRGAYTVAALYIPLKEKTGAEKAEQILEEGARPASLKKKASLEKMPAGMYLSLCRFMTKKFFGNKAGFVNEDHSKNKKEVRFDILSCPYFNTLKEIGCPEVCPAICRQDEYSYKGMKNSLFERTKTLGNGDDRCDFCYRIK